MALHNVGQRERNGGKCRAQRRRTGASQSFRKLASLTNVRRVNSLVFPFFFSVKLFKK